MKIDFSKMHKAYEVYELELEKVEKNVREVCDFNARITFCAGDGHLILNEENSEAATLDCLQGRSKKNKLTEEEHLLYCI